MTRVLFVSEAGDSSCTDARANTPAQGLRELGWEADVCSVMFENVDGKLYGFDHETQKQLPRPSILVVRHTRGPDGEEWDSVKMYEQARKNGQRIFFDMDDDMWNVPDWNPAHEWVTDKLNDLVVRNINACDGLIVSTAAIAEQAEPHVNVPVHVLPNGINPSVYRPRVEERRPLRLGWLGATDWRWQDFELVADALYKALAGRYGDVEFWHVGYQEGKRSVRELLGDNFPVEIVEYPWVPFRLMPWVINMLDCAIVPQVQHPFCDARSNISGLRLCAGGVPFAATSTREYETLWQMGAGYMVQDEDWEPALHVLCDPEYQEARRNIRNGGLAVAQMYRPAEIARGYVRVFS